MPSRGTGYQHTLEVVRLAWDIWAGPPVPRYAPHRRWPRRQLKPPRLVPLSRRRSELSMRLSRSRITKILMLVLGVLSTPNVGARAVQGPHCAKHEQSALHPAHHQASSAHAASVQPGTQHDCPHCPATECAHLVPCATSTNPVTAAVSLVVTEFSPGHVGVPTVRTHARSRTHEPPTPPPQLIA